MSSLRISTIPLLKIKVQEKGRIKDIKEIIVHVDGLPSCLNGQIVDMGDGVKGIIMGFDESDVLVLVLGDPTRLRMGKDVTGASEPFRIPVGNNFIGRMIDGLGHPLDERGEIVPDDQFAVFRPSWPITHRAPVSGFLPTGTKLIDVLIPIAKGQRQLILGDRVTGKTVLAVDAILAQKGRDCLCIYCCVGKSLSSLQKVISVLHDSGALSYTTLMVATDNSPVGEQYLVPFCAASMGEYFAHAGRDVLIVFDDLTKHAWAYRQLSLLMERPPGREAYPGDIFYVQTQLMERAGQFHPDYGGGSLSFLGIAETLQGDLTGYIPSNLASMCDGQICLSSTVFAEGMRPAIDLTLSLSIIGGRVHPPILKDLSHNLRSEYARYVEVVRLSKLQSGLSGTAQRVIEKGQTILRLLQQSQNRPVSIAEQVLLLYALDRDLVTARPDKEQFAFRSGILEYVEKQDPRLLADIEEKREMTAEIAAGLERAVKGFLATMEAA